MIHFSVVKHVLSYFWTLYGYMTTINNGHTLWKAAGLLDGIGTIDSMYTHGKSINMGSRYYFTAWINMHRLSQIVVFPLFHVKIACKNLSSVANRDRAEAMHSLPQIPSRAKLF